VHRIFLKNIYLEYKELRAENRKSPPFLSLALDENYLLKIDLPVRFEVNGGYAIV